MKNLLCFFGAWIFVFGSVRMQALDPQKTDSLLNVLKIAKEDTNKVKLLIQLAKGFDNNDLPKSLSFAEEALLLSEKIKYERGIANSYNSIGLINFYMENDSLALNNYDKSIEINKHINNKKGLSATYNNVGLLYIYQNTYDKALAYCLKSVALKIELNDQEGLANTYDNIGGIYYTQGKYNEAFKYYLNGLNIREKINDLDGKINSYTNMGLIEDAQGNFTVAINYFMIGIKLCEKVEDKTKLNSILHNIGLSYENMGNYSKATDYYLKALRKKEESGNKRTMSSTLNAIARMLIKQNQTEKAKEYLNKALKLNEEIQNKDGLVSTYINLGSLYSEYEKEKEDEAMNVFLKALKLAGETEDIASQASIYGNLAILHERRGEYKKAEEFHFKALEIIKETGGKVEEAFALYNIGTFYCTIGKYDKAIEFNKRSLEISQKIGAKDMIQEAYGSLSTTYEKMGNYKEAFKYHQLYSELKGSLLNETSNKQMTEMQTKYETEKKEKEIETLTQGAQILTLENSRNRYVIYGLSGGGLLLVVIAILFIRQQKLKAKRRSLELEQKLLRSQMNPHFIFNSLNAIQNFIYKNDTKESAKYLASFARLMRMILENSREEYVPLEKEISTLELYLSLQCLRFQNKFDFSFTIDPGIDPATTAVPPMLAQPFIENAIEHGLKHKETKGHIDIRFIKLNDNNILFEVEDNGIGRKNAEKFKTVSLEEYKSMATSITKERIEILNKKHRAKIKLDIIDIEKDGNSCGTKIIFSLPFKLFETSKFALN